MYENWNVQKTENCCDLPNQIGKTRKEVELDASYTHTNLKMILSNYN